MAKDPAFLFYYQDYSFGTRRMNFKQKGAYIDLLCEQADIYQLTIETIQEILGKDYEELWPALLQKFIMQNDKTFYNKKLRTVIKKRKEYSASRCANRTKSKIKGKKHMLSHDEHMENENEIENKDINKKEIKDKKIKHRYGEYKHVLLTDEEKDKLKSKFGTTGALQKVKNMDEAIELKGYKYKSHYLAILKWSKNEKEESNLDIHGNELPAL